MLSRHAISGTDWDRIKGLLPGQRDPDPDVPSPTRRRSAPTRAPPAPKSWDGSGGQNDQALGRSRGGFGTKIHGSFDGLGHPVELLLTGANESDIAQAESLLAGHRPEAVVADREYDKKALVEEIESHGAEAVIPTQKDRKVQRAIDRYR